MVTTSALFNNTFSTAVSGITTLQMLRFCLGILLVIIGVLLILLRPEAPGGNDIHGHGMENSAQDSKRIPLDEMGNAANTSNVAVDNPLKPSSL